MNSNVGTTDRMLRISAGTLLAGLSIAGMIGPWGYIGIVPLLTGLLGTCPAYTLFGIDTSGRRSVRSDKR